MNGVVTWPSQAETWLDERGKGAWIAAMVLGFVVFWPLGLALLAYMLFSGKFRQFRRGGGCGSRHGRRMMRGGAYRPSGNRAFDHYKSETLRRLEEEQEAFEAFLGRLREAKDKAEFDQFMDERARNAKQADPASDD